VRALAVDADLIVLISRAWQTTCTAVRAGGEGFVIDSLVYPDELEALPGVLEQAGFPSSGLLVTHGDWDHVLGRLAFAGASLGCGESTAERLLRDEPGAAQRELRAFDEEHYVAGRPPLALAGLQPLPVPGRLGIGDAGLELDLLPAEGHTADGTAFWIPWLRTLVCGDYLSPVEIPGVSGSPSAYLATLERFSPLLGDATTVVPGHGEPLDRDTALRLLEEDLAYVGALAGGTEPSLPAGRRTDAQRRIHAANLARSTPMES
jgi:glyoxylase-like metal-dependent hydrolase (beta-lactamase superfamily II)